MLTFSRRQNKSDLSAYEYISIADNRISERVIVHTTKVKLETNKYTTFVTFVFESRPKLSTFNVVTNYNTLSTS